MTLGSEIGRGRTETEQLNTSIAQETAKLESLITGVTLWNYGEKFGPFERTATITVSPQQREEIMNTVTSSMSPKEMENLTNSLASYRYKMDEFHNGAAEDLFWKALAPNVGGMNEPEMPADVKL